MTTERFRPSHEREAILGFLNAQRAALVNLLDGVSDEQARATPTVSALSLLGLLKHKTLWERRWIQTNVAGHTFPGEWPDSSDDWTVEDFRVGDQDTIAAWIARHRQAVETSNDIVAGMSLDDTCRLPSSADRNVRWVLLHLIEEYARHCGHGDIIRETLLGAA